MNPATLVSNYLDEVVRLLQSVDDSAVVEVAEVLRRICRSGGTVFVCGNGGSASTASHMACDLSKNVVTTDHGRLRVVSLNDNLAHFSAIANDLDYSEVFVEQLRNLMSDSDALLAISASGNSPNVVKAARFVRDLGAPVVGFTGFSGGELAKLASPVLHVPSENYGPVEDLHLIFNHLLVVVLRGLLSE